MTTMANAAVEGKSTEKIQEKRRALGRGLESLLPGPRVVPTAPEGTGSQFSVVSSQSLVPGSQGNVEAALEPVAGTVERLQAAADGDVQLLAIDLIERNPYQTRREFKKEALEELSRSIKVQGVLQPVVVRPREDGKFILILGERRLRASIIAEMTTIPALVRRVSEQQAAEMTLVENLQRQDLNCIEQADAFATLSKQFNMTQEEIAARAGLSRETVTNYMRLLNLPESVIGALQTGKLSYSHARVLLQLRGDEEIWKIAKKAMEEKMSVAKLEEMVVGSGLPRPGAVHKSGGARWVDPNVKAAQRLLEEVLGMRVRIRDRSGRGKILIEYGTLEDFDRVVGMLKGK
jgi:ParB family chromosome partitioning protein